MQIVITGGSKNYLVRTILVFLNKKSRVNTPIYRKEISEIPSEEYAAKEELYDVDLSLNVNPYGVSKKVMNKLKKITPEKIFNYYFENDNLINKIAEYMKVSRNNLMLGDGCDGCLNMIASTFIERNDEIIIPTPTFHRYEFHTKLMGGKPIFIQMKNFKIHPEDIISRINKKTKMIFLCNPNNPTGIEIETKTIKKILENFDGIVVVDEALADMTKINCSKLIKDYNNLIVVRSFSKTFGLASLRIGYIIANKEMIKLIKTVSSPFKVNGIAQEAALQAISDKEYIADSIKFINKNRKYLIENLNKLGLKCTNSNNTNFLVDISKINNDASEVVKLLKSKDVKVTNASVFRLPKNSFIRVSVGKERDNKKFIKIMRELKH